MASAGGLLIGAGAVSFAGNFKEAGGFPDNGYGIIAATVALTFLASTVENTAVNKPAKALAALMLLAACYRYIPALTKKKVHHG